MTTGETLNALGRKATIVQCSIAANSANLDWYVCLCKTADGWLTCRASAPWATWHISFYDRWRDAIVDYHHRKAFGT